eukprot:1187597-Prorocentrum_minimum.AAC.2
MVRTGSRHPKAAPKSSNFPARTSTGSAARWRPSAVSSSEPSIAPTCVTIDGQRSARADPRRAAPPGSRLPWSVRSRTILLYHTGSHTRLHARECARHCREAFSSPRPHPGPTASEGNSNGVVVPLQVTSSTGHTSLNRGVHMYDVYASIHPALNTAWVYACVNVVHMHSTIRRGMTCGGCNL